MYCTCISDSCFFGDYDGKIYTNSEDTCKVISSTNARYCYQEFARNTCCRSCANIYTGVEGMCSNIYIWVCQLLRVCMTSTVVCSVELNNEFNTIGQMCFI